MANHVIPWGYNSLCAECNHPMTLHQPCCVAAKCHCGQFINKKRLKAESWRVTFK